MNVAIAILANNEEKQIPRLIEMLEGSDADKIMVFDDYSEDRTLEIIKRTSQLKWDGLPVQVDSDRFDDKKNWIHKYLNRFDWILHIDADEQFDPFFLKNIKTVINHLLNSMSFAFKRVNLPDGKDYPDYQVRLLRTDPDIEWKGKYHEKPYSISANKPLLDLGNSSDQQINDNGLFYCTTLDQFPVIHLPRRKDIKRPWW